VKEKKGGEKDKEDSWKGKEEEEKD